MTGRKVAELGRGLHLIGSPSHPQAEGAGAMTIFLSWSGPTSLSFAEEFKPWLENVLAGNEVWLSSQDLDKGTIWFTEIINQLQKSDTGIIFITRDNRASAWLHFEAGALVKGVGRNRMGTVLIDLDIGDLQQPLNQINAARVNRLAIWQLVKSLNNMSDRRIADKVLERAFDKFWPDLENAYRTLFPASHEAARDLEQPIYIPPSQAEGVLGASGTAKKKPRKKENLQSQEEQSRLFNGGDREE
jgi:hypothetical protein